MEFNLTGVDLDIYYSINSSIQVGLFFLIVLPVLICVWWHYSLLKALTGLSELFLST